MKLHTLDQIDPLILKLERAVKQDDPIPPEQGHPDTTPLPVPVPAVSSLKAGDWIESHGEVPNVPHGSKLMVRLRGGTDTGMPTWWHDDDDPGWWAHNDSKLDIIAYRLVNP